MAPGGTPYRRRAGPVARGGAGATPAPEDAANEFRRPNLPPLHGTPSARRQYSYGAAEEPSPARPLVRADVVDLSGAVQDALQRHAKQRVARQRRQAGSDLFLEEAERQDEEDEEVSGQAADLLAMPPPAFAPRQSKPCCRC